MSQITQINDEAKGTFGYIGYSSARNEIVVAFRGSVNIANWVTNLNFFKKPYPGVSGAMVHEGFYDAYQAVSPKVISTVNTLLGQHTSASIVITGHSLGAALATIAAIDIKKQVSISASKITFYSFGSPRTGNQAFTDYIFGLYPNGAYQRVTHYNDVVPT